MKFGVLHKSSHIASSTNRFSRYTINLIQYVRESYNISPWVRTALLSCFYLSRINQNLFANPLLPVSPIYLYMYISKYSQALIRHNAGCDSVCFRNIIFFFIVCAYLKWFITLRNMTSDMTTKFAYKCTNNITAKIGCGKFAQNNIL